MAFQYIDKYFICNGNLVESIHEVKDSTNENVVVYEVFRLMAGKPLFLDDHLRRMEISLKKLKVNYSALNQSKIVEQLSYLCIENDKSFGNIELRAIIKTDALEYLYLGFIPHNYPNPIDYINGISTCLVFANRENPNLKLKDTSAREIANQQIKEAQCYEALLVNSEHYITEGSRSNVFFIIGNEVVTAPNDKVLEGISRKYVIKALKTLGILLSFKMLHLNELQSVDSAFLCGTSPGVLPIKHINEFSYQNANPVLKTIIQGFNDEVRKYLSE